MELTPFERIGVKNAVNRLVGPFVDSVRREIEEMTLSLDREEPNVGICLRRLRRVTQLVDELKREQLKWNEEV